MDMDGLEAPRAGCPRDIDAVLRLRGDADLLRGRIEPSGSSGPLEFEGWLELIAAIERLRQAPRSSEKGRSSSPEKDT